VTAMRPWMKWYPADWRADPRLRMCSLAARGLWADLISYMHEGEPYGHLTIDGIEPNEPGIAALVARPLKEVKRALAELDRFQVFSRTEAGVIFSRRMVRDKAKAESDTVNGKGGGNPKLTVGDKGGVNPPDKAHMPEARSQKESEDAADAAPSTGYAFEQGVIRLSPKDFAKWQKAYPNLDLAAELIPMAQWAGEQRDWFFAVSGALAKKNREEKRRREMRNGAPVLLTPSGNPWPEGIT